ncbi:MAG: DUF520 family protein [Fusobacteria bacterium]|nr:DUF520 family protein [Fusobacteriota bacterium]
MSKEHSMDIVSKINVQTLRDIIQTTKRTVTNRFDLKDKANQVDYNEKDEKLELTGVSNISINSIVEIFKATCIKQNQSIKAFDFGDILPAAGATVKMSAKIKQGLDSDTIRKINEMVKESEIKVKTTNQKDQIRVVSKSIDDLQLVIRLIQSSEKLDLAIQFDNLK